MKETFEQQLGLKHGVRDFTMTDAQPNGKFKVGFGTDSNYKTVEIDKETAIMVFAAFEGGKEWMREEFRLLLSVKKGDRW